MLKGNCKKLRHFQQSLHASTFLAEPQDVAVCDTKKLDHKPLIQCCANKMIARQLDTSTVCRLFELLTRAKPRYGCVESGCPPTLVVNSVCSSTSLGLCKASFSVCSTPPFVRLQQVTSRGTAAAGCSALGSAIESADRSNT